MTIKPDSPIATKFIQAANFYVSNPHTIGWVVIHDMESSEGDKTALNVANWFALKTTRASANYNVDSKVAIQSVLEKDVAWHAPGLSSKSIGVEHAGRASQTKAQWLDAYGLKMLALSAKLVADVCHRHNIPVRFVDAAGLLRGEFGITTHAEVTKAFGKSTHTDPGKYFPMEWYIQQVISEMPVDPRRAELEAAITKLRADAPKGPLSVWRTGKIAALEAQLAVLH